MRVSLVSHREYREYTNTLIFKLSFLYVWCNLVQLVEVGSSLVNGAETPNATQIIFNICKKHACVASTLIFKQKQPVCIR